MRRFLLSISILIAIPSVAGAQATPGISGPDFQIVESVPEATTYGEPGVPRTEGVWLDMIRGAKQSIDIAAFYISDKPGSALSRVLDALIQRAAVGINVRLLLDQSMLKSESAGVDRLRKAPGIEVRILPVDTLTGGVLHAKYMVVDNQSVFVGSQNWDWRALEQIHELGAYVRNARFARTFAAAFDFDWQIAQHPDLPRLPWLPRARPHFLRQPRRIPYSSTWEAPNRWSPSRPSVLPR